MYVHKFISHELISSVCHLFFLAHNFITNILLGHPHVGGSPESAGLLRFGPRSSRSSKLRSQYHMNIERY